MVFYTQDYAALSEKELKKEIKFEEQSFISQIQFCASEIIKKEAKIVFLAGGSCCGKTTTAGSISKNLSAYGKTVFCFSTDDFFKNEESAPTNADGTKNYDKFSHTDSDLICRILKDISEGKPVELPTFDFLRGCRAEEKIKLDTPNCDIIILEGIHALNDKIISAVPDSCPNFKISISLANNIDINENNKFEANQIRFIRRLIRDYKHRGADAHRSFGLWKNVLEEEKQIILPFIKNADYCISSSFNYEICVEKSLAMPILMQLEKSSVYYEKAMELCEMLELVPTLDSELVPKSSVINEFIR